MLFSRLSTKLFSSNFDLQIRGNRIFFIKPLINWVLELIESLRLMHMS